MFYYLKLKLHIFSGYPFFQVILQYLCDLEKTLLRQFFQEVHRMYPNQHYQAEILLIFLCLFCFEM